MVRMEKERSQIEERKEISKKEELLSIGTCGKWCKQRQSEVMNDHINIQVQKMMMNPEKNSSTGKV